MLTSAQRAKLRGMANVMEPILHIGKEGVTENIVMQADQAIAARELIKCTVQKNCDLPVRKAADALAEKIGGDCVQVIGRKFTLYKRSETDPKIQL